MPPKKPAAEVADPAVSSSDAPVEVKAEKTTDAALLHKLTAHPTTAVMVKEALQELDTGKGVSSQVIRNYIKEKYPSVDMTRYAPLVRKALRKGIETGILVRPARSSVTTGAAGKFRLAPKAKEAKTKKSENVDPNVQKEPKAAKDGAKDGAKKPTKAGATKKKEPTDEEDKSQEESKPPKKSKKNEEAAPSKVAPAKRPKAKKAAEKDEGEDASAPAKTKPEKTTKEAKAGKAPKSKAAKEDGDAPASKTTGKRGKKTAE